MQRWMLSSWWSPMPRKEMQVNQEEVGASTEEWFPPKGFKARGGCKEAGFKAPFTHWFAPAAREDWDSGTRFCQKINEQVRHWQLKRLFWNLWRCAGRRTSQLEGPYSCRRLSSMQCSWETVQATDGWFKKREGLVFKKLHGEAHDTDHKSHETGLEETWPKLREEYQPLEILNRGESGLVFWTTPDSTFTFCLREKEMNFMWTW